MLKNVTITLPEDVAHWARQRAAASNLSVSRFVGKMLEAEMRQNDEYLQAYQRWEKLGGLDIDARNRLTRDEANGRG